MAYPKLLWLDRCDPDFDYNNSPDLSADNLNKWEDGIYELNKALDNMSSAYGIFKLIQTQQILITDSKVLWEIETNSTDEAIFTFDESTSTITIKKAGTFSFRTHTVVNSNTELPLQVTTEIVDAMLDTVWHTETILLSLEPGRSKTIISSKGIKFVQADLPKALKVNTRADGGGMSITDLNYSLNTLASGVTASGDHSELTGTEDADCHPISAITNLDDTLTGDNLTGEAT